MSAQQPPAGSALEVDAGFLADVEDASLNASAPPQQIWFDGWLIRLSPGKAKRARSVNAVAAGRHPLERRIAQAERCCREAGLPLIFRITPFSQPADLDEQLAARGFQRFDETCVQVASAGALARMAAWPHTNGWRVEACGTDRLAEEVGVLRGTPPEHRRTHAQRLEQSPVPYRAWLLLEGEQVLACAQTAREGALVGLYDVFTTPGARGRGVARTLCAQVLAREAEAGARHAYLQVDAANAPALAVYRRLGFTDGYRYHYRAENPATA